MAYPKLEPEITNTVSVSKEELFQLYQEILDLKEANRIFLDVFRTISNLLSKKCLKGSCNQEPLCSSLMRVMHTLESKEKEPDVCPENYLSIMKS